MCQCCGSWKKSRRLLLVVDVQAACGSAGSLFWGGSEGVISWRKRWNLEHDVLDLFSRIKTGKMQWFLLQSSLSLVLAQASAICLNCLHRLPNCLLSVLIMCAAGSEEAAASDILMGAQPRIMCWARARSSSSESVDTATARRRQRVEDATHVGLQFPFRQERRGFCPRCHSRCAVLVATGTPVLPPADYMAPVPLKRKRDTSAEPKRDPARSERTRAHPTRRSCGSWTSTPVLRVSMARHSPTTFAGRSSWCRSSSGPWHPTRSAGGMTASKPTADPMRQTARGTATIRPFASCEPDTCCRSQAQPQRPHLAAHLPP